MGGRDSNRSDQRRAVNVLAAGCASSAGEAVICQQMRTEKTNEPLSGYYLTALGELIAAH